MRQTLRHDAATIRPILRVLFASVLVLSLFPLVSRADGQRHRELYRGTTADFGATWQWEPITANSDADNLRPIVPKWTDPRTALVWMRGTYKNNHGEWTTKVVATILP